MARRPLKKKFDTTPDYKYDSQHLAKFINYVMQDGKKTVARTIVYDALEYIKNKEGTDNPLSVFEEAVRQVGPRMEVRSRRIGGANYQVPREVTTKRRLQLAMRWLVDIARAKKGVPMHKALAEELIVASKGEGEAVRKKENMHKMAEANKAFAHFAW